MVAVPMRIIEQTRAKYRHANRRQGDDVLMRDNMRTIHNAVAVTVRTSRRDSSSATR